MCTMDFLFRQLSLSVASFFCVTVLSNGQSVAPLSQKLWKLNSPPRMVAFGWLRGAILMMENPRKRKTVNCKCLSLVFPSGRNGGSSPPQLPYDPEDMVVRPFLV